MIGSFRSWLLGIILTAFASGLALEIVPKGREKVLVRMVSGILAALAILRPLGGLLPQNFDLPEINFEELTRQQTSIYQSDREKVLSAIIAEKTETYIWDKAKELGLECSVRVIISTESSAIPLPESVELDAQYHSALAEWIEEVVGIPAEKQVWQEELVWEKKAEGN